MALADLSLMLCHFTVALTFLPMRAITILMAQTSA